MIAHCNLASSWQELDSATWLLLQFLAKWLQDGTTHNHPVDLWYLREEKYIKFYFLIDLILYMCINGKGF